MPVSPAALDVLRALLKSALAAEEGVPVAPVPLGDVLPRDLLEVIGRHRVSDALRARAELLGLPIEVTSGLEAWRERNQQRLLLQSLETVRAVRLLDENRIDVLVFKGQALAVQTTGRYDARGPGDIDLLVSARAVANAHRVLTASGWALQDGARAEPGSWAWRHLLRWGNSLTYTGSGGDVDLHWRLELTPDAHPPFEVLHARAEQVVLGGGTVPSMSRYDAIRHLAAHREGWIWMRTLVDLRRLARNEGVLAGPLRRQERLSLAVASTSVGLPASVPPDVWVQLGQVPPQLLDRVARLHVADVSAARATVHGGAVNLRHRIAASSSMADLQHTAMALVLPAEAVFPVRSRTAFTGVPRALALRLAAIARRTWGVVLARFRRDAPCAEQPERAA